MIEKDLLEDLQPFDEVLIPEGVEEVRKKLKTLSLVLPNPHISRDVEQKRKELENFLKQIFSDTPVEFVMKDMTDAEIDSYFEDLSGQRDKGLGAQGRYGKGRSQF